MAKIETGNDLRKARILYNLKQEDVAKYFGIARSTYAIWETKYKNKKLPRDKYLSKFEGIEFFLPQKKMSFWDKIKFYHSKNKAVCGWCGRKFIKSNNSHKYCCDECRTNEYNTTNLAKSKLRNLAKKNHVDIDIKRMLELTAEKIKMFKKNYERCTKYPKDEKRYCICEKCLKDIKKNGKCRCGLFKEKKNV